MQEEKQHHLNMDNQAYERNQYLLEQDMITRMKKRNDLIEIKEYNKGLD